MGPSHDFSNALFYYRQKYGYWPKSESDFSSSDQEAVKGMDRNGFESWNFGYMSNDTLNVYLIHEPIHDGTHVGIIPIPDKKIYFKSVYVFSNRIIDTKHIKKKQYYQ